MTLAFPVSPRAALQVIGSWAVPPLAGPQGLLTGCSHTSASAQEDSGFLLPHGFSIHIPPNTLDRPQVPTQDWRITAWCLERFPGNGSCPGTLDGSFHSFLFTFLGRKR